MWKPLCVLVVLLGATWAASLVPIEDFTILNVNDIDTKIKIHHNNKHMDLSGSGITTLSLPPLLQLTHLNLSSNYLKSLNFTALPRTITNLDLSHNLLTNIPKDIARLENLKNLNLSGNPVLCSCDLVEVRNALKYANVDVSGVVLCSAPPHLRGASWDSVEICPKSNIWDQMLGDGAIFDGSGSGDSAFVTETETGTFGGKIEDEFLTDLHPENSSTEDADYEGSGDDIEKEFRNSPPKPCYINCSTPPPLYNNDTNNTVSMLDGARILFEDISGKKLEDTTVTVGAVAAGERTFVAVTSKPLESEIPNEIQKTSKNEEEVNNSTTTAPSTAVPAPKRSKSTYILLAVLCIVIVMIIVFAIYKTRTNRRNKKRRQTDADNGINKKPMQEMTELAPLTKVSSEQDTNSTHLTNGTKNGKAVEETNLKDEEKSDGVQLRKKAESEALLTPEAKRVTIKAGEIPGSVPRTPLLVNRHISSDGNVITIPTFDQRFS